MPNTVRATTSCRLPTGFRKPIQVNCLVAVRNLAWITRSASSDIDFATDTGVDFRFPRPVFLPLEPLTAPELEEAGSM
jgi:hypothetical protein